MNNNWILDVLADLKMFALENGRLSLAEQIDTTALIAAADILAIREGANINAAARGHIAETGKGFRA